MTTVSKEFTFNSRETYLAFRSEWRVEYMQLSANIREDKNAIKNTQRVRSDTTADLWPSEQVEASCKRIARSIR